MKIIITERQSGLLNENFPPKLRRRLNYEELKGHLDFISENYYPCDYGSLGDFIGEMCDMMVVDLIEDYYEYRNDGSIDNKTKDDLYYFMVDNFADYLQEIYDKECK
jgi:hypothetical protein